MESMHAKDECKRLRTNVAESRDKLADLDAKVSFSQRLISFNLSLTFLLMSAEIEQFHVTEMLCDIFG